MPFLLATVLGSQSPSIAGPPSARVRDLVLISRDAKMIDKVTSGFKLWMPLSDLEKLLPKNRFEFRKWGVRGAVALDRQLWRIAELQQSVDLAKGLAALGGGSFASRIGDLSPDQQSAVSTYLDQISPPDARQPNFDLKDGGIGLDAQVSVALADPATGRSITVQLPMNSEASRSRDKKLAGMPIPPKPLSPSEFAKFADGQKAKARENEDVEFHLFGLARTTLPDGMRTAADLISDVEGKLKAERDKAARSLMKLLGLDDSLPGSAGSVGELPEELRNQLTESLTNSWQQWGLGSQQEAESLLANSNSISVTTWVGIRQCLDPGDPAQHRPGSFRSDMFIGCQGGGSP